MRAYISLFLALLLFLTNNFTHTQRRPLRKKKGEVTKIVKKSAVASLNEKQSIIFDLINVLFKENQIGFAQKIGYGTLLSYTATHWKNPGYRCLDMLNAMSADDTQKPHVTITLNGRIMPRCIVELQEGKKNCQETKNEIMEAIELLDKNKFFGSTKEKNLMISIMNLMLDPRIIQEVTEPIKPMITLAQKLKSAGHRLYLCANIPPEFYAVLEKNHPTIIALFDGKALSFHINQVKPNSALVEHLIATHNLDSRNCIAIDNLESSLNAYTQL